jgi:prepilin peptidase CpaA
MIETILTAITVLALLWAAIDDTLHRIIPDTTAIATAACGLMVASMHGAAPMALVLSLALFVIGLALFSFGVMGGGDVKLIAATGSWLSLATLGPFLLIMALVGGALGVAVLARDAQRRLAGVAPQDGATTVPYGVAIAVSGLFILMGSF